MRISGAAPQGFDRPVSAGRDAGRSESQSDRIEAIEPARAVVAVSRRQHRRQGPAPARSARPDAGFLAQLIATHLDLPQTRARRRAAPDEIAGRYQPIRQAPPMRTVELA